MAEVNPCFVLAGQTHSSETLRNVVRALRLGAGVVGATDLQVSAGGGMNVAIAFGRAVIDGGYSTLQSSYAVLNDASVTKAIAAADGTNPRKDLVYAKIQDQDYNGAGYNWALGVVTGTPGVSPARPATPTSAIALAEVLVPALSGSVTGGNITDLRPIIGLGNDATQLQGLGAVGAVGSRVDVARLDHVHPVSGTGIYKFYRNVLGAPAAALTITLPAAIAGLDDLVIRVAARSDSVISNVSLAGRFNGDVGSNYDVEGPYNSTATAMSAFEAIGQTSMGFADIPAANAPASEVGLLEIVIPNYAAAFRKSCRTQYGYKTGDATGGVNWRSRMAWWRSTAAITSITLICGAGNFITGSIFTARFE